MSDKEFSLLKGNPEQWQQAASSLSLFLSELDRSVDYDIVVKPTERDKTLKQLGALFSLWYSHILYSLPEHIVRSYVENDPDGMAKNSLHIEMKRQYLTPIILDSPSSKDQRRWVSQLSDMGEMLLSEDDRTIELGKRMIERHHLGLSLKGLNVKQMTAYMRAIEEGMHNDHGINIPIPDKYWKRFPPRYN